MLERATRHIQKRVASDRRASLQEVADANSAAYEANAAREELSVAVEKGYVSRGGVRLAVRDLPALIEEASRIDAWPTGAR